MLGRNNTPNTIAMICGAIKYIPKSFWKYVGWFLILIGIGMMFSFILRGSIKIERIKSDKSGDETEEYIKLEQKPLPGTKLTVIKDGKKVSIEKGMEEEEKPNE
ncbi:hypothetical protein KY334_05835 [Candidatus Woesearchaeota archaeon]|nr:hypothetical protein [Candidatus Woesearchaeota archaeon]